MWNDLKFGLPIMQIFALSLFLMGYFQVKTTFDDIYNVSSTNDQPMKIILILVDALRIDLFANDNFTFYQNMKKEKEEYQILYYGISSAPTATQLNLQTITTGNFPAFIDFGYNMAENELKEDNIIYSMKRNLKKIALLGDDTWLHMFPNSFDYKFVSESFDVRDLDTDDNIVINHIERLIDEKYDFIVGHLLGIDHSGHSYNDSNLALWKKQKQYSQLLYNIYNKMDNDTILMVVGDHGMSSDGNHGGDSPKEISSTIYAINKAYKFHKDMFNQVVNNKQYINEQLVDRNKYQRQIYSINIAPTISYLMGISYPFSNIGAILSEMINTKEQIKNSCQENYIQIIQYLDKLSQNEISFNLNLKQFQQIQEKNQFDCQNIQEQILDIQYQLKENSKTYDYFYLFSGIVLMILLFALHLLKLSEIQFNKQFCHNFQYFFYRMELYLFILPIFGLLLLLFNHKIALKFISIYFILIVLKIILQPLFNLRNIKTIIQKIIHPLPHYRQLFFVVVNIVVQKAIQELSADRQIVSTANIFGILLNILIMIFISQIKLFKKIQYIFIAILFLLLAEQYNINHSSMKPPSPLVFNFFSELVKSIWIQYLLPILFLQKLFRKIQMNYSFSIIFGIAQFIHFIYNCTQINEILNNFTSFYLKIFTVYIPFLLFICSIVFMFLYQDFNYFFIITIIVSGKSGMIVYCCLFYSIYYFKKFYNNIDNAWIAPILGATIQLLQNFVWYDLGHRMSFNNVKFQDALIGSESFSVLFNTTLLIISIFGVFTCQKIIEKIVDQNETENLSLRPISQQNERILDYMIAFSFSQVIFASIHNLLNLYHQNIIELFAQKIIYEAIIFIIILITKLIIGFLYIIQQKIQKHRNNKNYYIIENEIKEKNKV